MGRSLSKEFQMFIMSFGGSKDFQITHPPNYWKNLNVNNNVMMGSHYQNKLNDLKSRPFFKSP
jgi:hypothetical protein